MTAYDIFDKAAEFCRDFEVAPNSQTVAGLTCLDYNLLWKTLDYLFEEVRETERAVTEGRYYSDVAGDIVDGFADVAFVAINGIYKTVRYNNPSLKHTEAVEKAKQILERVCDANLAKKQPDGTIKYDEKGKVMKPKGWKHPDFWDILEAPSM